MVSQHSGFSSMSTLIPTCPVLDISLCPFQFSPAGLSFEGECVREQTPLVVYTALSELADAVVEEGGRRFAVSLLFLSVWTRAGRYIYKIY